MNDLLAMVWTSVLTLLGIFVAFFLIGLTSLTVAMFLNALKDVKDNKDGHKH